MQPVRGGSNVFCPLKCGWKAPLTVNARSRLRRFRRHWEVCPERPQNKIRVIRQRLQYGGLIRPFDSPAHRDLAGKIRKVETVELPA